MKALNPEKNNDLQQQKLKEVEDLLIEENGSWRCKECNKINTRKTDLRKHAEMHVSGLSFPCPHCSMILTTRSRLACHMKEKHKGIEK